jgi:hypothetical protein
MPDGLPPFPARPGNRKPCTFKERDVKAAIRAALAAGLGVTSFEIDPTTGKIIVVTAGTTEAGATPVRNEWDRV